MLVRHLAHYRPLPGDINDREAAALDAILRKLIPLKGHEPHYRVMKGQVAQPGGRVGGFLSQADYPLWE